MLFQSRASAGHQARIARINPALACAVSRSQKGCSGSAPQGRPGRRAEGEKGHQAVNAGERNRQLEADAGGAPAERRAPRRSSWASRHRAAREGRAGVPRPGRRHRPAPPTVAGVAICGERGPDEIGIVEMDVLLQRLQAPLCGDLADERMIEHDEIIAARQFGDGRELESMQRPRVPSDVDLGIDGAACGCRREQRAGSPGDAATSCPSTSIRRARPLPKG